MPNRNDVTDAINAIDYLASQLRVIVDSDPSMTIAALDRHLQTVADFYSVIRPAPTNNPVDSDLASVR